MVGTPAYALNTRAPPIAADISAFALSNSAHWHGGNAVIALGAQLDGGARKPSGRVKRAAS